MEVRSRVVREPGVGPLYGQVAQQLRDQIHGGELKEGDSLPGELALASAYAVSRPVIRQALSLLEQEGLVYRVHGRGTFVMSQGFRSRVMEIAVGPESDTARFRQRLNTKVLVQTVEAPPVSASRALGLKPGSDAFHLRRIRYFDGEPLAILESYIPTALAPGLDSVDLTDESLYEQLELRWGLRITRLRRSIKAAMLDPADAKLLDVTRRSPCLRVASVAYDTAGRGIEDSVAIYRADKITLVTELDAGRGDFHREERK